MKIGVSAFAWTTNFGLSHLSLLPEIRERGLCGLEIPMFNPESLATADIRRAFEANDLECTICAILPEGINPISADAAVRKKSLVHLRQCVETSAEMGAHLLGGPLFAPIGYLPGRRRNEDEWKWAVESFQALGDVLDANDVTLSIEPVNRSETFFLRTASDAKEFCEAVNNPRVGVTIDTFHANIEEKNTAEAVRSLARRLKHVHASENDRGLLGTGHVDFPAIVAALRQIDYCGYLMIEGFGCSPGEPDSLGALWGDVNVSPEDIAFQGAAYLQGLLGGTSAG
ncbi:MAG: sugar phosphate isomerase/epimerase family protein [Candidatus Sulfotelmatobacter sp.]